ncbi:MAG: hypothetical protein K2X47_11410, partial [Bdellovibrionales bacterium]|nr:hypothetical protein [Bdellovibrionales bacterium]
MFAFQPWGSISSFALLGMLFSLCANAAPFPGKIISIQTWTDPEVPFVTPYKIERLSDGSFISLGWGQLTPREEFWLVKRADATGKNFQTIDRLPLEKGLQKHARAVTEVKLSKVDSRVRSRQRSTQEIYVTGLDSEHSRQGVLYFALVRKSSDGGRTWINVDR